MKTPVVFVHGLWLHASSWQRWADLFRQAGYEPLAPGWPGESDTVEESRAHPERVARLGVNEVTEHYAKIIHPLPEKPIVIGHSFGGLIVQKLLGMGLARAAIAIDAAPIKGVLALPISSLRVGSVALKNPFNWNRAIALNSDQFHYGFTNTTRPEESAEIFKSWTIPSPARPFFQAAFASVVPNAATKVNVENKDRGPLLLITGGKDHTAPSIIARSTLKIYRRSAGVTDFKEFEDQDHSLILNSRWREVADYSLSWLKEHSL